MAEKIEKPKLPSPVKVDAGGLIVVQVSGRLKFVSTKPNAVIKRID